MKSFVLLGEHEHLLLQLSHLAIGLLESVVRLRIGSLKLLHLLR